jgi:hypothetical protein
MESKKITFEQLPDAISQLCADMEFLKCYILARDKNPVSEDNNWFDINQLRLYLPDKPAKATLYAYVSANTIPHHKGPKKLRFLKSEIDAWLKQGKNKTIAEIQNDNDDFLRNQGSKKSRSR